MWAVWSWFEREIIEDGRLPLFLAFLAFIVTFAVTRGITRMIRTGRGPFRDNVSASGVHVHHAVPGVILLTTGAFLAVGANGTTGWAEIAGVMVGVGTSLVLDEFALILRLDDVYWSEEGRVSVEMVALAFACVGLALIGANPFRVDGSHGPAVVVASFAVIGLHLLFVAITVAKGKYRMALLGTFVVGFALVGALRLAQPTSRWARRRYDDRKMERARERADTFDEGLGASIHRWSDRVAGAPDGVGGTRRAGGDERDS